jgi:soluble lytic murein transglycosylase-like protein
MRKGFIFGGSTGVSADEVARRRALADAYLAKLSNAPRNVGEGLTAIGNALAYRGLTNRADAMQKEGTDRANQRFAGLFATPQPSQAPSASSAPAQGLTPPAAQADDPLIQAVIQQESAGNPNAVSPVGARGLMQVMPKTGVDPGFGVQPLKDNTPAENVRFGTDYLGAMRKRYGGDLDRALVAYNWGPGNADKWDGNLASLPDETRNYVLAIRKQLGRRTNPMVPPALNAQANSSLSADPQIAQLTEALADPFLPPAKKSILEQMLALKVKRASPEYQRQLSRDAVADAREQERLELQRRRFASDEADRNTDNDLAARKFEFDRNKPASSLLAEYGAYAESETAAGRDPMNLLDYQRALKGKGVTITNPDGTTVQIGGDGSGAPTKGQTEVDKVFAKDFYTPYVMGGAQDIEKNLSQLDEAVAALESGQNLTGPMLSMLPDTVRASFNPESVNVRDLVAEVAQRNLREVLGGQFAQKEGEALIARAYNETLPEDVNARRVRRLMKQIKSAADAKVSAIRHFEENGTLRGWKGRLPSMADFDPLRGEDKDGGGKSDNEADVSIDDLLKKYGG